MYNFGNINKVLQFQYLFNMKVQSQLTDIIHFI